jgi:hypothetical protein
MNIDDAIEKLRSAKLVANITLFDGRNGIRGGTKSTNWMNRQVYKNDFVIEWLDNLWKGHIQGPGSIFIRYSCSSLEDAVDMVLDSYLEIKHFGNDSLDVEQAITFLDHVGLQSTYSENGNLIEGHPAHVTSNPVLSRFVIFRQGKFYLVVIQQVDNRVAAIKYTPSLDEALNALRTFWKSGTSDEKYFV